MASTPLGPYTKGSLQAAFRRGYYMDDYAAQFSRGIVRESARHALPPGAVWDALDLLLDTNGKAVKRGGCVFAATAPEDDQDILVAISAPEFSTGSRVVEIASSGATRTLYDVTTGTPAAGVGVNNAQPTENPPLYNDLMILCDGIGDTLGSFYPPQKVYVDTGTVTVADLGAAPPNARYSCVHLSYLVLANSPENPNRLWFSPVPVLEPQTYNIVTANTGAGGSFVISGDHTAEFVDAELSASGDPTTFHVQGSTGNDGYYSVASSTYDGGGDQTTIVVDETVPDGTGDGTLGVSWDVLEGYIDTAGPITGLASIGGVLLVFHRGTFQRILGDIPPGLAGENMALQPAASPGCVDARSIVSLGGFVYFADETGVYRTNGAAAASITTPTAELGIGPLWAAAMADFAPALGAVVCAGTWLEKWLFVTVRHPDPGEDAGGGARYQFLYYVPSGAWARLADGVTADMYATRLAPNREIYAACGDVNDPVRPLALSPIFTPTGDNMQDANGDDVIPLLELSFGDAGSLKAFQYGSLTHLLEVPS